MRVVLLGRGMSARTHKVVSLVPLLQLVSTLPILREHRSRDLIESRVLAVFGSMFRCQEIKKWLEGDGGDQQAPTRCRARRLSVVVHLSFFPGGASPPLIHKP